MGILLNIRIKKYIYDFLAHNINTIILFSANENIDIGRSANSLPAWVVRWIFVCFRGKSGLDAGWSFIWFSVLQNIKIIILLYFEFVICNEFWTVRIISLGKWHRSRGNSFLTAIGNLLKFFEIVKAIAGCNSGTFRKIPKMYEQLRRFKHRSSFCRTIRYG